MASFNKYIALAITSVLFGLMHIFNDHFNWVGFVNISLSGVMMGIYYIHKKNLWFPIGAHFMWNFFQGPVFGFSVSGMSNESIFIEKLSGDILFTGGDFGLEGSILVTPLLVVAIFVMNHQYRNQSKALPIPEPIALINP